MAALKITALVCEQKHKNDLFAGENVAGTRYAGPRGLTAAIIHRRVLGRPTRLIW
jgi:hypothetical protein